jgi:hypothetical protein
MAFEHKTCLEKLTCVSINKLYILQKDIYFTKR